MPPLRSGRASKACDLCRKQKTRCYASNDANGICLRCKTLSQPCSLTFTVTDSRSASPVGAQRRRILSTVVSEDSIQSRSTDARLDRLERTVETLLDRLDSRLDALTSISTRNELSLRSRQSSLPSEPNSAPVFVIRDAATDAGVYSPEVHGVPASELDLISAGFITTATAHSLLTLFRTHYGRWVKFSEEIPIEALLSQVRKSPLLLCSIFLIAVRHMTQELADSLAPKLFQEAKRLVTSSLLVVPQSIGFFQATLILSLWSTTIGQVPLSIDGWLLTGYALQQGLASPEFSELLQPNSVSSLSKSHVDACYLWNHLCIAHLQLDQPRSQFLQMGFHFAHLLAYCQSLKSPKVMVGDSLLAEMVRLSQTIINLAIDTTDERTRHLTDHIYHIVTFSTLTLCRLVHTYESTLRAADYDIVGLDNLVQRLIDWLKSIGLPCHATHMLGDIISARFKRLRPNFSPRATVGSTSDDGAASDIDYQFLSADIAFLDPEYIGADLFNLDFSSGL
ncbi:putative C6 finger domain protein [Dactylonectria estremocensis]|uniref:Transcriptional activator of proteases prtT n=1 Tax=Dactylonectria estremocensis TaxID=1079267 RepID=A0A9P9ESQ5_9HYPO|nr:putative C6 finger domain protein [Dactylonectria estremocensis]